MKQSWFRIVELDRGVFAIEERPHVQSYLVNGTRRSALIDTGMGFGNIRAAVAHLLRPDTIVLNTHWHFDHVGGNVLFEERGISLVERHLIEKGWSNATLSSLYLDACLSEEIPLPDDFVPEKYEITGAKPTFVVRDGDAIDLGGRTLEAIATPGHTRGSTSFLDRGTRRLFCGDLVDRGTIFANFEDSDIGEYAASLEKIVRRSGDFDVILPSHNRYPLAKDFAARVKSGFDEVVRGLARRDGEDGRRSVDRAFVFDEFAILARRAGSPGVRLRND